jgi:hypothetical protein
MILDELEKKGLITPPPFVVSNTAYLTITGSHAYGVADTSVKSRVPDYDCYGFCLPPKNYLFKHLNGVVDGFGDQGQNFEQYSQHHIMDKDAFGGNGQEWDLTIYNIVKFFELCRQGNPNMLDTLYTPENCLKVCTGVGRLVRDNRRLFLSKFVWKRFRGYAWEQMHKMDSKEMNKTAAELHAVGDEFEIPRACSLADVELELSLRANGPNRYFPKYVPPEPEKIGWLGRLFGRKPSPPPPPPVEPAELPVFARMPTEELKRYYDAFKSASDKGGRFEMVKTKGYDVKFAYHIIRLLDEAEQLMTLGEMDLQRAKDPMKAIRRGEWKVEDVRAWAMEKEKSLSVINDKCLLPDKPDEEALKKLLMQCLEEHYGNLSSVYQQPDWAVSSLSEIDRILTGVRAKMYGGKID